MKGLPWRLDYDEDGAAIYDSEMDLIIEGEYRHLEMIVRAVNAHGELLEALDALAPFMAMRRLDDTLGCAWCNVDYSEDVARHHSDCPTVIARAAIAKARGTR